MKKLLIEIVLMFGLLQICSAQTGNFLGVNLCCAGSYEDTSWRPYFGMVKKGYDTIPALLVVVDTTKMPFFYKENFGVMDATGNYSEKKYEEEVLADDNLHFVLGYLIRDKDYYNLPLSTDDLTCKQAVDSKFKPLPENIFIINYFILKK